MENNGKGKGISRREFIKAAGVTAAGLMASSLVTGKVLGAIPAPAHPRVIGANDRINYAIIGVGGIGNAHLDIIKSLCAEQNLNLVAVCDLWEKRRLAAAKSAGISESMAYKDYRKLLENKDIDVVVVSTPDHWHAPIAIAAMQAGKHVYVEKPMTRYLDEAFEMLKVAKDHKCLVQVGSQGCTDAKWHTAGKVIADGKVGTVLWAQGGYCRNNPHGEWNYGIDPDLNEQNCYWKMWLGDAPKRDFSPERFFRWRKYWDYGTGIIGDLWPHRLHPLMIAMNNMQFPHRVVCLGANICKSDKGFGEERDVADTTQMIAEFPDGSQIQLVGSTVNDYGPEDLIRCNKACLFFGGGKVRIQPQGAYADEIEQEDVPVVGPGESQTEHHKNLIHCIRNGGKPNCNIDLAVRVQTIVSMAELSYRQNKMAVFDPAAMKLIEPSPSETKKLFGRGKSA